MKIQNILITLVLATQLVSAQDVIWQHKTGGAHADFLYDAVPTLDYGFLLAGASLSQQQQGEGGGNYAYMLTKYDEDGQEQWTKFFGGNGIDHLKQIVPAYDGGYLLAGISNSKESGNKTTGHIGQFDIWLIKLDMNGNEQWQKTLGGLANEHIGQIIRAKDGGFFIAGSSASNEFVPSGNSLSSPDFIIKQGENFGGMDYWLVKLASDGNALWQKSFGGKYNDVLKQIYELPDGSLLLAGHSASPVSGNKSIAGDGHNDWWLIKTDASGKQLWQKSYGDNADDKLFAMIGLKDGNILLGGNSTPITQKSKKNTADIVLIKINPDGDKIWETTFDNNGDDFLTNILQNPDGTLILGAYTAANAKLPVAGKGKDDFLLIKTQANGNELWRRSIGTRKKEVLQKIIGTRDGGYVLVGSSIKHTAKGDSNSDFLIVKIADKDKPLQEKLPLEAIPNPALSYTKAVVGKDYDEGTMQVIDLNGKVLQTRNLKGERIIPVRMDAYPAGVYIIHIKTGKAQNSVKVLKE